MPYDYFMKKQCSKCKVTKLETKFQRRADSKDGRRGICKVCLNKGIVTHRKECPVCDKEYEVQWSFQKYCSPACRYEERKKRDCRKSCMCKQCGEEFIHSIFLTRKFCSNKCQGLYMKKSRLGEDNPAYRNGMYSRNKRGPRHEPFPYRKWKKRYKEEILARHDCIRCEKCYASGQRLEFHHIVYRSEAPRHKNLHDPRNNILLCVTCHNWFHNKKSHRDPYIIQRKMWELFPKIIIQSKYEDTEG
jgi:hypothetical protein